MNNINSFSGQPVIFRGQGVAGTSSTSSPKMTDEPNDVGLSVNNTCIAGNHVFLFGQQFCKCGKVQLVPKCIWTESFDTQMHEYFWYTTCGTHYCDNPSDNGFIFCPSCGKKIEAKPGSWR